MGRKRPKNTRSAQDKSASTKPVSASKTSTNDTETTSKNGEPLPADTSVKTESKSPTNDPAWYAVDDRLLLDAASVPFSQRFGDAINFADSEATHTGAAVWGDTLKHSIPGVLSLRVKPTIGQSRSMLDPANVCANAFYTHVRYVNSGRKNYDPADLMMYAMAVSELYSMIMWCQRLYAYTFMYSQRNKYIARSLIMGNGINPDSLLSNLANFRYWLNTFIAKTSAFVVPANINFFKRKAFMYAGYYTESPTGNIKDQLYQFVPAGFYRFQVPEGGAGMLSLHTWKYIAQNDDQSANLAGFNELKAYCDSFWEYIYGDEDFGLMSGDILKAYGNDIIGVSPMPEDMAILPEFDPHVLSQMKNATVVPLAYGDRDNPEGTRVTATYGGATHTDYLAGNIYQNPNGVIVCSEVVGTENEHENAAVALGKLISVESPDPGPVDVMEATRLTVTTAFGGTDEFSREVTLVISGDFICTLATYSLFSQDRSEEPIGEVVQMGISSQPANGWATREISSVSQFKYGPLMYAYDFSSNQLSNFQIFGNVDNYTMLHAGVLTKLHECALLALMYVQGVAKIVS